MDTPDTASQNAEETRESAKPVWTAPSMTELPVAATLFGGYFGGDSSFANPHS